MQLRKRSHARLETVACPGLIFCPSGLNILPLNDLFGEELIYELEVVWLKDYVSFDLH
jgi:hypothetical protein